MKRVSRSEIKKFLAYESIPGFSEPTRHCRTGKFCDTIIVQIQKPDSFTTWKCCEIPANFLHANMCCFFFQYNTGNRVSFFRIRPASLAAKWSFFSSKFAKMVYTIGFMMEIDSTRRETSYAICCPLVSTGHLAIRGLRHIGPRFAGRIPL